MRIVSQNDFENTLCEIKEGGAVAAALDDGLHRIRIQLNHIRLTYTIHTYTTRTHMAHTYTTHTYTTRTYTGEGSRDGAPAFSSASPTSNWGVADTREGVSVVFPSPDRVLDT